MHAQVLVCQDYVLLYVVLSKVLRIPGVRNASSVEGLEVVGAIVVCFCDDEWTFPLFLQLPYVALLEAKVKVPRLEASKKCLPVLPCLCFFLVFLEGRHGF